MLLHLYDKYVYRYSNLSKAGTEGWRGGSQEGGGPKTGAAAKVSGQSKFGIVGNRRDSITIRSSSITF